MASRKNARKIWVIKVGSAIYVEGGPLLMREWVQQVEKLKSKEKIDVIWVTSGAIASARLRMKKNWTKLPEKQALSALGQPMLMDTYNLALQSVGLKGAQVLLTYDDIARTPHRDNLKNTLRTLLEWDVVPILNENDAVATEEIQFGDNDLLSAKVAALMQAERLVIMTNVEGLFDKNPAKNKDAVLVPKLETVTKALLKSMDQGAVSEMGRGGMFSKLRAAECAQSAGVPTWIIRGDIRNALLKIAAGQSIGTSIGTVSAKRKRKK